MKVEQSFSGNQTAFGFAAARAVALFCGIWAIKSLGFFAWYFTARSDAPRLAKLDELTLLIGAAETLIPALVAWWAWTNAWRFGRRSTENAEAARANASTLRGVAIGVGVVELFGGLGGLPASIQFAMVAPAGSSRVGTAYQLLEGCLQVAFGLALLGWAFFGAKKSNADADES